MVAKDKKANAHPEAKSLGGGAAGAVEGSSISKGGFPNQGTVFYN